jgi:NAD(P)-dependent dehydrogenase (short-subunit alcohol dehydrogenase family)
MGNYLVIGGSSGIGLSLVEKLSEHHQVWATYNKHAQENRQNVHYNHLEVQAEQLDLSFVPDQIDGFVYCPGTINLKPFARIAPQDFINDYQINVIGAIKCLQQILPNLKKSGNASIVLFSTVAVQTGLNFHSIVSSSKGAIEGLTKALSAELAPTIRVNCIAPSLTDTPLADALLSTEEKIMASSSRHPLKRVGRVNDISSMASFLLSPENTWITGQIFHVDGGMSSIK